jgi:hypothetical protein
MSYLVRVANRRAHWDLSTASTPSFDCPPPFVIPNLNLLQSPEIPLLNKAGGFRIRRSEFHGVAGQAPAFATSHIRAFAAAMGGPGTFFPDFFLRLSSAKNFKCAFPLPIVMSRAFHVPQRPIRTPSNVDQSLHPSNQVHLTSSLVVYLCGRRSQTHALTRIAWSLSTCGRAFEGTALTASPSVSFKAAHFSEVAHRLGTTLHDIKLGQRPVLTGC